MKKSILLAIFLIPCFIYSQDNNKYIFELENGIWKSSHFRDDKNSNYTLGFNFLYNLNDIIYLGLGSQYTTITNYYVKDDYSREQIGKIQDIPLYLIIQAQNTLSNRRPFANLRFGYTFSRYPSSSVSSISIYNSTLKENHGIFINPKIGYEYRLFKQVGIYASLGMRFQRIRYTHYNIKEITKGTLFSSTHLVIETQPNKPYIINIMKAYEFSVGIRF